MNILKIKINLLGIHNKENNMKNENEKKVEFKPIKLSEEQSKQITQVDDILTGENAVGNQKIVLVNMITETINSKKVNMAYKSVNKLTGIEKTISFDSLNQITNKDVKGLADTYKKWLGVEGLKSWASTTDNGKERMRILKEALWVAIVTTKKKVITKNKKGEQFTGNKNSEIFVDGEFAKEYSNNEKGLDMVSMKFAQLKRATQNYIADKKTPINSTEVSVRDNGFQSLMKKSVLAIDEAKEKIVLGESHSNDLNSVKSVFIKSQQYIEEHNKVQLSLKSKRVA
tara:strand:+ start:44 stop:898 length:855 start_codon:yes stop_codon:yes gene_type:complete